MYSKGDLKYAYIDFLKFLLFIGEKVPTHSGYNSYINLGSNFEVKIWINASKLKALSYVEDIVFKLDDEEDRKIQDKLDLDLIDEFDGECHSSIHEKTLSASVSNKDLLFNQEYIKMKNSTPENKRNDFSILKNISNLSNNSENMKSLLTYQEVPSIINPQETSNIGGFDDQRLESIIGIMRSDVKIIESISNYKRYSNNLWYIKMHV